MVDNENLKEELETVIDELKSGILEKYKNKEIPRDGLVGAFCTLFTIERVVLKKDISDDLIFTKDILS